MERLKKLEKLINRSSTLQFTRIEEGENYYLYERMDTSENAPVRSYEIFKKKISKVSGFRANAPEYVGYTHYEIYPSDEDFGSWAWSCSNLERVKMIKEIKGLR